MDDLIKQGASAFKAGDLVNARKLLTEAIKLHPDDERAWGWMYNVCKTDRERILCLKQMLRINPKNEKASLLLSELTELEPPLAMPSVNKKASNGSLPNQFTTNLQQLRSKFSSPLSVVIGVLSIAFLCCLGLLVSKPIMTSVLATATAIPTATPIPSGFLEGTITWETKGAGNIFVVGVTVKVWSQGKEVDRTTTDSDGRYEIKGLIPGLYTVSVFQSASSVGDQIAEKCWVFKNVVIKPVQTTKIFMDFNNVLETSDRMCENNPSPPPNENGF